LNVTAPSSTDLSSVPGKAKVRKNEENRRLVHSRSKTHVLLSDGGKTKSRGEAENQWKKRDAESIYRKKGEEQKSLAVNAERFGVAVLGGTM